MAANCSSFTPDVTVGVRELLELERLRAVAHAARDLESTLAKLIRIGEIELKSTDISAEAIKDRLNAVVRALRALDELEGGRR